MSNSRLDDLYPFDSPPRVKVPFKVEVDKLYLTDTTLRDGQQGWKVLTVYESIKIYELLVEIAGGSRLIKTTELYLYTSKDRAVLEEIKKVGAQYPEPIGWVRASIDELRLVVDSGLQETTILTSISDYHIKYKFGLDRETVISKYLDVVEFAMRNGVIPRCTLEDITRADLSSHVIPFLMRLERLSEKYKMPFRLKLADTLGLGVPFPGVPPPRGLPSLIQGILGSGVSGDIIIFHGHNDFGLAVANGLATWIYGGHGVETTLAGIGERAGNTPMEPMLIHLAGLGRDLDLRPIGRIPALLEELGFSLPDFYPLIGKNAFKTKAGIHVDGLLKNPQVYLPFDPERVLNLQPSVDITPYSGRAGVLLWLKRHMPHVTDGIHKDHPLICNIYNEIVDIFNKSERTSPLSDEEMKKIVSKYIGSGQIG